MFMMGLRNAATGPLSQVAEGLPYSGEFGVAYQREKVAGCFDWLAGWLTD
jgi:hypothetical protein